MRFDVKVNKANNVSKSLRITMPVKIAEALGVDNGDEVEYVVVSDGNKLSVLLEKKAE